jgi:hypothetical protein
MAFAWREDFQVARDEASSTRRAMFVEVSKPG